MTRADAAMVQLQNASATTAAAVTDMHEKSEALCVKVAEHETKLEKAAENFGAIEARTVAARQRIEEHVTEYEALRHGAQQAVVELRGEQMKGMEQLEVQAATAQSNLQEVVDAAKAKLETLEVQIQRLIREQAEGTGRQSGGGSGNPRLVRVKDLHLEKMKDKMLRGD